MSAETVNIASFLSRVAACRPYAPAIFVPAGNDQRGRPRYSHYTYQQLDETSDAIARGLEIMGIGKGVRTVLMVKPGLDLFALTFALFKSGVVPVVVDPGIGLKHLKVCLANAEPEAFIGIPAAHAARVVLRWSPRTIRKTVSVGGRFAFGGTSLVEVERLGRRHGGKPTFTTAADDMAAILFTSGSTGPPKGVVYTHGNFVAQVEAIRALYEIQPGEVDLATFPLFGLFDPALGMTTVVPEMDPTRPAKADPRKIIRAIEDFGVTNVFGSPALLNTVGRWGVDNDVQLPTVKRVISSGAPVAPKIIETFCRMLGPEARVHTGYGATESLPVASISSAEILSETRHLTDRGAGVCVGRPVACAEVSIIEVSEQPVPEWKDSFALGEGQIGEIVVRGPQVTHSYYNSQRHTDLAKIYDSSGDGLRHRMGDMGYIDEHGRLWMCGRKSHRVELDDETLFTVPCEGVFNSHPAVFRSALVGVQVKGETTPVLCVELEEEARDPVPAELVRELRALAEAHDHTHRIRHFLIHPAFPVDIRHNAKIGREKLALWASRNLRRAL